MASAPYFMMLATATAMAPRTRSGGALISKRKSPAPPPRKNAPKASRSLGSSWTDTRDSPLMQASLQGHVPRSASHHGSQDDDTAHVDEAPAAAGIRKGLLS